MIHLCRHIFHDNRHCKAPAVTGTHFCRHHQQVKTILDSIKPTPENFGLYKPLPFVFPEDRASIQTNLFLVLQAFNDRKIDPRTANCMTYNLQVSMTNLGKAPLIEDSHANTVQRVILTPEGDEIAPPREQLEEGEAEPLHHKDCPCQRCAEQYRNAAPEQHHQNCQCGLCEPASAGESEKGQGESEKERGEREKGKGESETTTTAGTPNHEEMWNSSSQSSHEDGCPISRRDVGGTTVGSTSLSPLPFPLYPSPLPLYPIVRVASAHNLYSKQLTIDPANKEVSLYDYLYGDKHKQYEAQYAARARAAIEAGIEPPPYEPFDPKKIESEGMRRYKATMEEVEKNKQIAKEIWQRRFGNEDPQLPKSTELNP